MPVTLPTFRWTEAYSVHVALLDHQHRQFFAAVDELDRALRTGAGDAAIDSVLDKLVNHAAAHFAAEESLMLQHEFPGLFTHCVQHEMFRETVAAFLDDHRAAKPGVPVSLLFFLQTWLKDHVLKTDKQYSAFLNARGVR